MSIAKIQDNFERTFKLMASEVFSTDHSTGILSEFESPYFNSILKTKDIENNYEIEIENVLSKYRNKKPHLCWFINDTSIQKKLDTHLTKAGFVKHDGFNGMALDLAQYNIHNVIVPHNVEIIEITNPEQLDDWAKPLSISFGFSENDSKLICKIFKQLIDSQDIKHYIAYSDGKPIGSASVFFTGDTAGLYNLAVLPEYRNQGIGSALQQTRLNLAKNRQCSTAIMQAVDISAKLGEKLGFVRYNEYHTYVYSF